MKEGGRKDKKERKRKGKKEKKEMLRWLNRICGG